MLMEGVPIAASTSKEQASERIKEIVRQIGGGGLNKPGIDRNLRDRNGVRDPAGFFNR